MESKSFFFSWFRITHEAKCFVWQFSQKVGLLLRKFFFEVNSRTIWWSKKIKNIYSTCKWNYTPMPQSGKFENCALKIYEIKWKIYQRHQIACSISWLCSTFYSDFAHHTSNLTPKPSTMEKYDFSNWCIFYNRYLYYLYIPLVTT